MSLEILAANTQTLNIIIAVLMVCASYVIGSIPFGIVIGKGICHVDIREQGSKNIGTTNAIRVLGKKVGFTVFFFDVFKGMFVILIARILNAAGVFYTDPIMTNSLQTDYLIIGLAAILGHSFSMFLDFKGGKAVATSLGVVFMICPIAAILCLIVFGLTLKISGYVSLASTFATLTVLTTVWVLFFIGVNEKDALGFLAGNQPLANCIIVSCVSALIILKHRKNYIRLINGTENSFKKKKENKTENNNEVAK